MGKRENTLKRHRKVVDTFLKYYNKKENGKRVHTHEYCVQKAAEAHCYSPGYVTKILTQIQ